MYTKVTVGQYSPVLLVQATIFDKINETCIWTTSPPNFKDVKMACFCSFAPSSLFWVGWGVGRGLIVLFCYNYFAECEIGVSERAQIHSLGCSVGQSFPPSLGRKLLFVFPLTNAQLDLTKRKMLSNGPANVRHSEIIIMIDFSYVRGMGFFKFELF